MEATGVPTGKLSEWNSEGESNPKSQQECRQANTHSGTPKVDPTLRSYRNADRPTLELELQS